MKTIGLIAILGLLMSCSSPKNRANQALKLSIDGEYTKDVIDYNFDHKDLFTFDPYVESYIDSYKSRARVRAMEAANLLIDVPNLIDDFQFVKMETKTPKDIISVMPFEISDGVWLTDMEKQWYVEDNEGVIDNVNQFVRYTEEKGAERATLYYILRKGDKKERYKIDMVCLDGEWKIYYCMPENFMNSIRN